MGMKDMMQAFQCAERVHCKTCRAWAGGRNFRQSAADKFGLGDADFDCPEGAPWDYTPPADPVGLGDTIKGALDRTGVGRVAQAAIKAVTGSEDCGCNKRRDALNKALPYDDRPCVLVMRREVNRKEVLDCVRDALGGEFNAVDVEMPFTLDAIRQECERRGNVITIIRAEEHGRLFVNRNWKEVCGWAHEQGIQMLQVDFGYFDHYGSRLIAEYGPDGEPVMDGWGDSPGATPEYILQHFDRVDAAGQAAREAGRPIDLPYVVIWTGCHVAMARKPFREKKVDWLRVACQHILESCALPVIKDGGLNSCAVPEGVHLITHRDIEKNASLAVHAHNNIICNSSVSNELCLWGVPVTALGRSWYDGKDVFYEARGWRDAIDPRPINHGARQDWVNWWINHQCHKDEFPNEILRRVKYGHGVLGGHG